MKKLNTITTIIFIVLVLIFSIKVISAQTARSTLDDIIAGIPEKWWDGGWDKISDLTDFINSEPHSNNEAVAKAKYWIGCNYYANREHKQAIDEFESLIKQYPDAWFACAMAQFEIGQVYLYRVYDYQKALEAYNKVITEYPICEVTPQAQRMIAYTYLQSGDHETAKTEYEKLIRNYPNNKLETAKAYWEMGEMFFNESLDKKLTQEQKDQKLKDALSAYKQANLYCPSDESDLDEWTVDSIVRAFRYLDGNSKRSDAFVEYQRYAATGDSTGLTDKSAITDPLAEF